MPALVLCNCVENYDALSVKRATGDDDSDGIRGRLSMSENLVPIPDAGEVEPAWIGARTRWRADQGDSPRSYDGAAGQLARS